MYSLSLLLQCHLHRTRGSAAVALLVFLVFIGRVPPLKMPIMTSFGYVLGQSHSFSHPFPIIFGCPCETTVCHQVVSHPVLLAYVAHDLVASVLTYTADAHSIYVSQCLSSSCQLAINNVYGCNLFSSPSEDTSYCTQYTTNIQPVFYGVCKATHPNTLPLYPFILSSSCSDLIIMCECNGLTTPVCGDLCHALGCTRSAVCGSHSLLCCVTMEHAIRLHTLFLMAVWFVCESSCTLTAMLFRRNCAVMYVPCFTKACLWFNSSQGFIK